MACSHTVNKRYCWVAWFSLPQFGAVCQRPSHGLTGEGSHCRVTLGAGAVIWKPATGQADELQKKAWWFFKQLPGQLHSCLP